VAPGVSPGALTITGNLLLLGTSSLLIELGGGTQGVGYDYLSVGGSATLGGNLSLSFLNGYQSNVPAGSTFTILTAHGPGGLIGSFANVLNGQRLFASDGFSSFVVNYGTGSAFAANSVVLSQFASVPEPSTWAMIGIGAVVVFVSLRRRRK
jgi:hypothetical protein